MRRNATNPRRPFPAPFAAVARVDAPIKRHWPAAAPAGPAIRPQLVQDGLGAVQSGLPVADQEHIGKDNDAAVCRVFGRDGLRVWGGHSTSFPLFEGVSRVNPFYKRGIHILPRR